MHNPLRRTAALMIAILSLMGLFVSPARAASYTCSVNTDKVFLRMKANTSSNYYDLLQKGDKVTLMGVSGDFFKVQFKSFTGFIMRKFLTVPSAALKEFKVEARPASKYAKIKTISGLGEAPKETRKGSSGDAVEKLQRALQIKGYLKGTVDGKYGEATAEAVRKYQRAVKLSANGAANSATIAKLFGIASKTTIKDDPGMSGIKSIAQISVPNTSSPGSSGKHVKTLQQALKLKGYYKGMVDSSYGKGTQDAVKRYQRAVGLSADGIAGFSTIRKLFGKNAANYTLPTEKLDWFSGGKNTIPQWASFTIKDISTGKTFKARRWSGYNHLDAEPLSEDDAKTMKEISGGSFSWARRAVLVKYNGHVYAASINTMPHGSDTIPGNNFEGHFCVHFYKSKTHETNKVDATHQNAVARAMKASW